MDKNASDMHVSVEARRAVFPPEAIRLHGDRRSSAACGTRSLDAGERMAFNGLPSVPRLHPCLRAVCIGSNAEARLETNAFAVTLMHQPGYSYFSPMS